MSTASPNDPRVLLPTSRSVNEWVGIAQDDLGGDVVDYDLSEQNVVASLNKVLELWSRYRPKIVEQTFELSPTSTSGGMSSVITFYQDYATVDNRRQDASFIRDVIHVRFVQNNLPGHHGYGVNARFNHFHTTGPRSAPRMYGMARHNIKDVQHLLGIVPDYKWDKERRILYIAMPSHGLSATVWGTRERYLHEISFDQRYLFRKMLIADIKYKQARALVNGEAVGPNNTALKHDGKELRAESQKEMDDAIKQLEQSLASAPLPMWSLE